MHRQWAPARSLARGGQSLSPPFPLPPFPCLSILLFTYPPLPSCPVHSAISFLLRSECLPLVFSVFAFSGTVRGRARPQSQFRYILSRETSLVQGYFQDLESGGCKIKVGGGVSSRSENFFFQHPPPQMGCKHHPMGGVNTPVFDIDLKNPGIALQANSLRGDVCSLAQRLDFILSLLAC